LNGPVAVRVRRARPGEPLADALERAERHELVGLLGETLESPTRVALAWDDQAIALRAWMVSSPPIAANVTAVNGPVYQDECVELFVSAPGEPARYVEVVVNALGVSYAARVFNPEGSRDSWEITRGVTIDGLRVSVDDGHPAEEIRHWTATLELPWRAGGGAPAAGETRAGNVTRIARGTAVRYETLSPTLRAAPPDFHVPARFAALRFEH
jgi:hypothetical protein